jgi:hypothetical protein
VSNNIKENQMQDKQEIDKEQECSMDTDRSTLQRDIPINKPKLNEKFLFLVMKHRSSKKL